MPSPMISVLMGVYYHRQDLFLLKRSVASILEQSFTNFEVLICDDGSCPEAKKYLAQIAKQDNRISFVHREKGFSLPEKLNACLKVARGQLLARMDDDDYSYPERFEKQLKALGEHPEIAFVGTNIEVQRKGKLAGESRFPEKPQVKDFFFTQPYAHPTLMFRRSALLDANGYSESPYCILCEDYDLLLRLYTKGYQGINLQENLLLYNLPDRPKGSRKLRHRWNETITRYCRFKELGVLPEALPYIIKPLAVGITPEPILNIFKEKQRWRKGL